MTSVRAADLTGSTFITSVGRDTLVILGFDVGLAVKVVFLPNACSIILENSGREGVSPKGSWVKVTLDGRVSW